MGLSRLENSPDGGPLPAAREAVLPVRAERRPPAAEGGNGHAGQKRRLHQRLLATIPADRAEQLTEPELRGELGRLADQLFRDGPEALGPGELETLVDEVFDEVFGYGPIGLLMRDHEISDILINGPRQVFIERRGQLQRTDITFRDETQLVRVIQRMVSVTGRQLDERSPMVDARLPDGSRLNAVLKPPALNGPLVSIRRFGVRPLTAEDLVANDSLAPEMLEFLAACVKGRINVIVSGGTGSGKTTLLNALSRYIPATERVVTIEDTAELELQQPHVAKMEAVPPDPDGQGAVTIREMVRNALRMRPDRIIVGECRGPEALEMLQAMNTGHDGSLTTVHANSTREAFTRIEMMIGLSGIDLPPWAIRKLIASSVNLIVQVARLPGGKRRVVAVSEVTGTEGDMFSMHDLFEFRQTGTDGNQATEGFFRSTGIRPLCYNKLLVRGAAVPVHLFSERRLQAQRNREPGR
jgi:pilus assembly protein CpaF